MDTTKTEKEHFLPLDMNYVQHEFPAVSYAGNDVLIIDDLTQFFTLENYKVEFNVCFMCMQGKLMVDINGETNSLHQGQVFLCHSNAMLTNFMVSPDFACKVLCITDHKLKKILQGQADTWIKTLYQHRLRVIDLHDEKEYIPLYTELKRIWEGPETIYKKEIVDSLLRAAMLELCEKMISQTEPVEEKGTSTMRCEELFQQFIKNITERKKKKVGIGEYAQELFITPKYLYTICKKVSGKSPLEWISEYVLEDVRFYLCNTELSAKEIAYI